MRIRFLLVFLMAGFFALAPLAASAQEVADRYIGVVMDWSGDSRNLTSREIYSASSYSTREYSTEVEVNGQVIFVAPSVLERLIEMNEKGALFEVGIAEVPPVTWDETPPEFELEQRDDGTYELRDDGVNELRDDGYDFDCKIVGDDYWPKGGPAKSSPSECKKACMEWGMCVGWSYKEGECRLFMSFTQSDSITGSGWYCGYK